MSRGKYLSLEEARRMGWMDRFCEMTDRPIIFSAPMEAT